MAAAVTKKAPAPKALAPELRTNASRDNYIDYSERGATGQAMPFCSRCGVRKKELLLYTGGHGYDFHVVCACNWEAEIPNYWERRSEQ